MIFHKYFVLALVVMALTVPADAGWGRRLLKNIGRGVKKAVKQVGKVIKSNTCKMLFGVACPVAVGAAGTALSIGSSSAGTAIVGAGVIAGNQACRVRRDKCKRSVNMTEIMLPFSDEISDYDMDGNKLVTYKEFVGAVLHSVDLADPDELIELFVFSDFDGNGVLDMQEFNTAPLLFAHASRQDEILGE